MFGFFNWDESESGNDIFNMVEQNATWLISLGCVFAGAATFYMGTLYGKAQAEKSNEQIARQVEANLAARIANHGWRPGRMELAGFSFYVSYFKPALLTAVAFPILERKKAGRKFILLNVQTRELSPGVSKDVFDFACGFYQSNQADLAYKQLLLGRVNSKKRAEKRPITASELQEIMTELDADIKSGEATLKELSADQSVIDTAIRELQEETGQKGLTLTGSNHFLTRVVQGGSYVYNLVELNYRKTQKVEFKPEEAEGVRSSHLIELKRENFRFERDEDGNIQGEVLNPDTKKWGQIKTHDDAAAMLAFYLKQQHDIAYEGIDPDLSQGLQDATRYEHKMVA